MEFSNEILTSKNRYCFTNYISVKKENAHKKSFMKEIFLILVIALPLSEITNWNTLKAQTVSCDSVPDIIYYNGTIITMDSTNPFAEAIAIKSDTITKVGSNEEILALSTSGCSVRVIDLNGLTILPGFNDSHSHWFSWREHICSVTGDTTYPSLEEIMQMLSMNGWTSISELNFGRPDYAPEHLNNALDLDSRGKLSIRLNGYWGTLDDGSLIDVLADSMRTPERIYTDRVRAPGVKMYVDDPFGTTDILTQEQTSELVQLAHSQGWQVAAHAVNESAVEKILTAYENVLGSESNENYRYRIEHAVKVSDDQLNRMKQKGIVASFQLMGPPDWPDQFTFQTYISNTNPEWCLRWKDFIEAEAQGLHNTGSTDAPFNDAPCDYSPFRVIYQAVTRKGYLERMHADWELNQRLTIGDCLKLLTVDGAYATFEEDKKGSLTPGKWADLTIVSENPLEVSTPEDLLNIKNYLTMVGGKIEYCDDTENRDLCSSGEVFNLDTALVTASDYLPDQTPDLAFDNNNDTNWGSGGDAPQWIKIDLLNEFLISGIELVIDQWPAGQTIHQIWAKRDDPTATFELLHEFNGNTAIDQILSYTAPTDLSPYRYFKILTIQSPSWVSWKEIKIYKQDPTSVNEEDVLIPHIAELMQNYPNPFNPITSIEYFIPNETDVSIIVYNLMGEEIATLVNTKKDVGFHKLTWDGRDRNRRAVASGVYIYRMKTKDYIKSRKLILLK
jgi:dihydroorotase-like cyclic amidohydrolase